MEASIERLPLDSETTNIHQAIQRLKSKFAQADIDFPKCTRDLLVRNPFEYAILKRLRERKRDELYKSADSALKSNVTPD